MLTLLGSSARYKTVLAYIACSQWCISESLELYKANVHETYLKNILKVKKYCIGIKYLIFFLIVQWIFEWFLKFCAERNLKRFFFSMISFWVYAGFGLTMKGTKCIILYIHSKVVWYHHFTNSSFTLHKLMNCKIFTYAYIHIHVQYIVHA